MNLTALYPFHRAMQGNTLRVPLHIQAPIAIIGQPITLGVPFPRGLLSDADTLCLHDAEGTSVPLQTTITARWPDGSVKWLLVDFLIEAISVGGHFWTLQTGSDSRSLSCPATITETEVRIPTGVLSFALNRSFLSLPMIQRQDGTGLESWLEMITSRARLDTRLAWKTPQGLLAETKVEDVGPVRVSILSRGDEDIIDTNPVLRLCFFPGTGLVRIRLTITNPRPARHQGGLWDLGEPNATRFTECTLHLPIRSAHHKRQMVESSARSNPVVSLREDDCTLSAAVFEFWQQSPRIIEENNDELCIRFWSSPGEELQPGEQKTHTVWLHVTPSDNTPADPLTWVHQPAVVAPSPEWIRQSGVLPYLPAFEANSQLDQLLRCIVEGPHNWFDKRDIIGEYGWRNYGEVYADHENAHSGSPKPIVSHYNNQYDVLLGLLMQYFRTGDVRFWQLADPLARHIYDIDIYHTQRDRAAYNGGMFWHTDHYKDAATCTHRAYSKANAKPGQPYGGGPSCEHNYTTGLLVYHYLTGDPLARDAVLELANWVINMDDGSRNILGVVDDGPTGLASATREPTYHGPGRGAGNSINALLDAWLLTSDQRYLNFAEMLIRRCIHPNDDITAHNLLDLENRWSYTVFLSVLSRYLDLKSEAEQLDKIFAYAQMSLLHYARWMLQHELPYFDQTEKLEYATETWAAQEMRKANVLRLASRHTDEPLRDQLWQRGTEMAERAWSDLLRFDSRYTTRPLAITMREGTVDLALRQQQPPPAPRPEQQHNFGQPEQFVPQKQRVKAKLKSPRGLLHIGCRLLNPLRWWRYWRKHKG